MTLDKIQLIAQMQNQIEAELATLLKSMESATEAATHEESKPENKYDTRGLEASYLAGAQRERIADLRSTLLQLKTISLRDFTASDRIAPTALVELDHDTVRTHCLLLVLGGGYSLRLGDQDVVTITTQSPLGRALIGKTVGELAVLGKGPNGKEYEIVGLC